MTDFATPFTLTQARAAGLTRRDLQGPEYRRLMHGVYAPTLLAEPITLLTRVEAARLVLPTDAIATVRTALRLKGFDLGEDLPLSFVTRAKVRTRHAGVRLRTVNELPPHQHRIAGAADACAHVLDTEDLLAAVIVTDRALQQRLTKPNDLLVTQLTRRARAAYAHVDPARNHPRRRSSDSP